MDENLKLLILESKEAPSDRRLLARIDRAKALNAISASGAKVRHDSGGRLMVIEARDQAEKSLAERLPEARLVPVDVDVKAELPDLDETESLFLDALRVRTSETYRDAKSRRKFGETPEEQELVSGPDVREEY
jgi:hypothetical protein